jgi:membrane protein DedA with SNARE-associated domain
VGAESSLVGQLLQQYGYLAVLVGALLEGETILLIAGFASHRGYLDLGGVIAVAAAGGFLGDQGFFWLGRLRGNAVIVRWPKLQLHSRKVNALLERHHTWIIVGIRFMYGLRVAGPVLIGMSEVGALRFAVFNLIGAILWAVLIGGAGYLFGQALELALGNIRRYEELALAALVAVGILTWAYHRFRARRLDGSE